jgi:hypothetical protein
MLFCFAVHPVVVGAPLLITIIDQFLSDIRYYKIFARIQEQDGEIIHNPLIFFYVLISLENQHSDRSC